LRVLTDAWFLAGVGFGLLAVIPKILLNYGVEIGHQGETWAMVPGAVATLSLVVGVFCAEGRYVYLATAAGVVGNGLLYWLIGVAVRRIINRWREGRAGNSPGSE
jgi:hypothetical protein